MLGWIMTFVGILATGFSIWSGIRKLPTELKDKNIDLAEKYRHWAEEESVKRLGTEAKITELTTVIAYNKAEFQKELDNNPALKTAFAALTPGRQRAYNLYFSAPKQSKTRESRVEKYTRQILEGKGLDD